MAPKIDPRMIDELTERLNELHLRVQSLEGRNARTETELSNLKVQVEDQAYYAMKSNLVFTNLQEMERENAKERIIAFLKGELKIPNNLLQCEDKAPSRSL